jgi:pimeloyl-ACP methyl ester carboxylesterase
LLVGTLLSGHVSSQNPPAKNRPIVLLHGGWQGGWCWKKLTPLLLAEGHSVYTPTLTGMGDRTHLANLEINLDTHIQDVLAFLEMEDLNDVVLVGHSYAGFIISAVAERAGDRLHSLVYLDAFVPENGKRMTDYILPKELREAFIKSGRESGFLEPIPLEALGVSDSSDLAWATPRVVKQPFATFDQPIRLTLPAASNLPHTYIACTNSPSSTVGQFAEVVRDDPSWNFYELSTGHQAMMSAPLELSQILLAVSS